MTHAPARTRRAEGNYAPAREPRHLRAVKAPTPEREANGAPPRRRAGTRPDAERRTIQISSAPSARRRSRPGPAARAGAKPDRLALWAVMLGLLLALVAAASGQAGEREGEPEGAPPPVTAPR